MNGSLGWITLGLLAALATALRALVMALVMVAVALGTGQLAPLLGGKTELGGRGRSSS